MTDIPVIVVDDSDVDRYLLHRVLSRAGGFTRIADYVSGEAFLARMAADRATAPAEGAAPGIWPAPHAPAQPEEAASKSACTPTRAPMLVMMDINMPGLDGFDTITSCPATPPGTVRPLFVMCSSSHHPHDHARAKEIAAVKGFVTKPPTERDAAYLRQLYADHCATL